MGKTIFHDQVHLWLRDLLGEDPFPDGIPDDPPAWLWKAMTDTATIERNWAVFRARCHGERPAVIAKQYGVSLPRVYETSQQVVAAIIRARRQATTAPSEPPPLPPSLPPSIGSSGFLSVLERDCAAFNALRLGSGYPRLRAKDLMRVGIAPRTSLAQVPDHQLLRVRDVGPTVLAAIRRLFPVASEGSPPDDGVPPRRGRQD
jgi:hypothetical protein